MKDESGEKERATPFSAEHQRLIDRLLHERTSLATEKTDVIVCRLSEDDIPTEIIPLTAKRRRWTMGCE
jgi:hypothetical protein